eukprot:1138465-Rhodomonas_salina.2
MQGPDLGGTDLPSAYAVAMRCPVLTSGVTCYQRGGLCVDQTDAQQEDCKLWYPPLPAYACAMRCPVLT